MLSESIEVYTICLIWLRIFLSRLEVGELRDPPNAIDILLSKISTRGTEELSGPVNCQCTSLDSFFNDG